jgi:hypothetical protein
LEDEISDARWRETVLQNPAPDDRLEDRRRARAATVRCIRRARQATDEWKTEMLALHFKLERALDRVAEERLKETGAL